jgi:hypothetical protein
MTVKICCLTAIDGLSRMHPVVEDDVFMRCEDIETLEYAVEYLSSRDMAWRAGNILLAGPGDRLLS